MSIRAQSFLPQKKVFSFRPISNRFLFVFFFLSFSFLLFRIILSRKYMYNWEYIYIKLESPFTGSLKR